MTALLATCEGVSGSARTWGIVLPPLVAIVWAVAMIAILRPSIAAGNWRLLWLFAGCAALGALILLFPEGVPGNGDYLGRFRASVGITAGVGLFAWLFDRELGAVRSVGAAIAGDVFIPGLLVLLLIWLLSLSGSCLD